MYVGILPGLVRATQTYKETQSAALNIKILRLETPIQ